MPPPEQAPRFADDPRYEMPPGSKARFGSALAAGQFTRPRSGQPDAELAIGVPNWDDGAGKVVRILKNGPSGTEVIDVLPPERYGLVDLATQFGAALAAGDFDDDRYDDLAIGAPEHGDGGSVIVQYGGPAMRWVILGPPDDAEGRRGFGSALATGDFDHDGTADLVVGEPGEQRAGAGDPARVWVVWGRDDGPPVGMGRSTEIAIPAGDEQGNVTRFGASLAAGNFVLRPDLSQLSRPDIAIGAPLFDRPAVRRSDVGRAYVFKPILPDPQTDGFALQVTLEPRDGWESYAKQFGFSLAAGNFNGDLGNGEAMVDLAIGAPQSSIPEHDNLDGTLPPSGRGRTPGAGLVFIAPHVGSAVSTALRVLSQDRMGMSQKADNFGWSVAGANFNSDDFDDLAIGSPNEKMAGLDLSGVSKGGALYFRFGNDGDWNAGGGIPQVPSTCFDYIDAVRHLTFSRKSDRFGSVLLPALFDDDDAIDLIVGAPDADIEGADGLVKDAGAVWIGLNQTTPPGPFDGVFTGPFRDDACGGALAANMTFDIHNRDEAVCGVLTTDRDLCFEVDDEEAPVARIDTSVIASNLGDSLEMHLEYPLRNPADGNRKVGNLSVDASVPDAAGDLTVDLSFRGSGVRRSVDDIVLDRQ